MVRPVINARMNSSTLGVSNGSNKINKIYKYGVERLYMVIFFSRKTCKKIKKRNRTRLTIMTLIILFFLGLQSRLLQRHLIHHHVYILQLAKIHSKFNFQVQRKTAPFGT